MNYPAQINLNDKVIIVSGGYGYLGSAIVKALLLHNATVIVGGRSEKKYQEFAKQINEEQLNKISFENFDISSTDSIKKAFERIFSKHKKINTLINNAFYLEGQSPETMSDEEWEKGIDGTLSASFRCIREVIPYLRKTKSPGIINVSSMYGVVAPDFSVYEECPDNLNPPHYGAAKAGLIQLTKYYSSFLGKEGIRVNTVTPGPFPSEEVQKDKSFISKLANKTCLKRIGRPEELAGIFVFLASDAASYITGQNIIVDGGWTTT